MYMLISARRGQGPAYPSFFHFHLCVFSARWPNFHEFLEQFVFPTKPSSYLLSCLSVKCVRQIQNSSQNPQNLFVSPNRCNISWEKKSSSLCFLGRKFFFLRLLFFQQAFVSKHAVFWNQLKGKGRLKNVTGPNMHLTTLCADSFQPICKNVWMESKVPPPF